MFIKILFRYTRNLVEEVEGKFSLILLCWPPGSSSSIHDHPNSDCIMKCLRNQITETRYDWPDNKGAKMNVTGVTQGVEGEVIHINGKALSESSKYRGIIF